MSTAGERYEVSRASNMPRNHHWSRRDSWLPFICCDILSLLFVLGGAIGFLIMKGNPENHMNNFGDGAVYFGWLGTLVGLIAITGNRFLVWGDIEKMEPALTVSMLPILYGYTVRLINIALSRD